MSRHTLHYGPDSLTRLECGYDRPLHTFYAQVYLPKDKVSPSLWLGALPQTMTDDVRDFAQLLLKESGLVLPEGMAATLADDRDREEGGTQDSPFQQELVARGLVKPNPNRR